MVKVKGRIVIFTGKDLKQLKEGAKLAGMTPRQFLHAALKFKLSQDILTKDK